MNPLRNNPSFRPGESVSLEELRRINELAGRAEQFSTDEIDSEFTVGGVHLRKRERPGFWARLTVNGGGALYSWQQVQWFENAWLAFDGSLVGAYDDPASGLAGPGREVNGNAGMHSSTSTGEIVWLYLADDGESWEFFGGPGGLIFEQDNLAVIVSPCNVVQAHYPTFLVVDKGGGVGDLMPNYGTQIQPVAAYAFPGVIDQFPHVDHVHPLLLPTCDTIASPQCGQICYTPGSRKARYWDCSINAWIDLCCDQDGSGSGSGSGGCTPGVCSDCTSPPMSWALSISGFSAPCNVFNGGWTLTASGTCTWTYTKRSDTGVDATVTITISGSTATLSLLGQDVVTGATTAQATYTGTISGHDCCSAITFTKSACSCDSEDDTPDCSHCSGPTPSSWYTTINFPGALGQLELERTDTCQWIAHPSAGVTVWLLITEAGTWRLLYINSNYKPALIREWDNASTVIDCCSPLTLTSHTVPNPAVVTPDDSDCDSPPGTCPATIVGTPTCCDHGPVGDLCCPDGLPDTLTATVKTAGGAFICNVTLPFSAGVGWRGFTTITADDNPPGCATRTYGVWFFCPGPTTGCSGYSVLTNCDGGSWTALTPGVGFSCDCSSATFGPYGGAGTCPGGCDGITDASTVLITP